MSEWSPATQAVMGRWGLRGYAGAVEQTWERLGLPAFDFTDLDQLDDHCWRELRTLLAIDGHQMRPRRREPSVVAIVRHWAGSDEFPHVRPDRPACFRCDETRDRWVGFDRAHLVDRALGGLDVPGNLVILCRACHVGMGREYWPEEYRAALTAARESTLQDREADVGRRGTDDR